VSCASSGVLWGVDATGAIYRGLVRTEAVADPALRVAVQEEQSVANPLAYRYSIGSAAEASADGFKQLGAAFVAYRVPQPGTVPIYQETQVTDPGALFHYWHRGEAEARSFGWVPTRVAFHAYLYPAPGTVPVYRETVSGTASYHFSINSAAAAAQKGFLQSDIAFYAYPPQALPVSLALPAQNRAYDWAQSFKLPEPGRGAVSFVTDATSDVHIAIGSQRDTAGPLYEIVIGAANNGQTVIRRAAGGTAVASGAGGLLGGGVTTPLWVSVNRTTGLIRVGRDAVGQNVLLSYTDPGFLADVQYFTFSSGDTPIKYSEITAAPLAPESLSLPAQNRSYDWTRSFILPESGRGAIVFTAPAAGEVQLAIGPQRASTGTLYEIVINGASSGQTVIRRAAGGAAVASAATGSPSPNAVNRLWVSLNRDTGLIQIGRDVVGQSVILSYKDPAFLSDALFCALTSADAPIKYSAIVTQALPPVLMKWGQVGFGSNQTGSPLLRTSVNLPSGFELPPVVLLVSTRGEDYSDTFQLSTSGVGATSSQVNLYRTDAITGWGQSPGASLLASNPVTRSSYQSGSSVVGSASGNFKQLGITFALPFTQVPRLLVSARGADSSDSFAVTPINVSASGFTANVTCLNGQALPPELRLDWIAFTPDGLAEFRAADVAHGLATLGSNVSGIKRVAVSFNKTFSVLPTLLLTPRGEPYGDNFSVTATNVTTTGFTANIKRAEVPNNGWGQNLMLDWLALV
jgi:hypothetical protein